MKLCPGGGGRGRKESYRGPLLKNTFAKSDVKASGWGNKISTSS